MYVKMTCKLITILFRPFYDKIIYSNFTIQGSQNIWHTWTKSCKYMFALNIQGSSSLVWWLYFVFLNITLYSTIFVFSVISQCWDGPGGSNPFSWKSMINLSCMVNTMAAADQATQGSRASVAMVMTFLPWNILVSAPGSLMIVCRTYGCHLFTVYNFRMIYEMTSILWLLSCEICFYDGFLANWLNICLYFLQGCDFIGLSNDKILRLEAKVFVIIRARESCICKA